MSGFFGSFTDKETRELKDRVIFAMALSGAVFFVLAVRLWYLQIKEADYYRELAENNRIRSVKSPAPRGMIYDRLGVKVAENRPGFDLYLVTEDVKDWTKTKEMLNTLIGLEEAEIEEKLERSKSRPPFQAVKLREDLSWEETVKIEASRFEMPGVMLEVSPKRSYVYAEALSHLLGHLGEINEKELKELKGKKYILGDMIGKYGMEKAYEDDLRGIDGSKDIEVDAFGRKVKIARWSPSYPGNEMTLTIDIRAQLAAWAAMKDSVGAVIAMDPKNGRVLALYSSPPFDPNLLSTGLSAEEWAELLENPKKILMNRAIQAQYPPASTFKPIHAAAALEEKALTPSTIIFAGGSFWFAGREYRDWKPEGHGRINYHRAIVESSDTFFYQTGLKLGVDTLARYSKGFGFGSKTGIPLANEKSGIVPSKEWKETALKSRWYDGETISVSVGQGYMLSTPLQLVTAYAAIANGGDLYTPQLVEEVRSPSGDVLSRFAPKKRGAIPVSKETIKRIKDALKGVTHEDGGTANFLRWSGLRISGKTGTAQVSKLVRRTKNIKEIAYELRDHAWFAGYAPYDDPKIAVVVLVEHGGFGASAAAPVAREVIKAYLAGEPGFTPEPRPAPTETGTTTAEASEKGDELSD